MLQVLGRRFASKFQSQRNSRSQSLLGHLLTLAFSIAPLNIAAAITFDKFDDANPQVVIAFGPSGNTVGSSKSLAPSSIIGGNRYISVSTEGPGNTAAVVTGTTHSLSHSQDANTKGGTVVIWDGNPMPGLQPTGLGGVDFTKDGATALKLGIKGFDYAFDLPVSVSMTIYDASDPTALQKVSFGTIVLTQKITSLTYFELPFASLSKLGSGADLHNVGAIALYIDGHNSTDSDLTFGFIGTNGNCDHVPVNGFILDQCNVCNGDNSTCKDCEGVPNGTKLPGTSCPTGGFGLCGDGTYTGNPPSCSCTPNYTPKTEICDSIDNNCDGVIDEGFDVDKTCTAGVGACKNTGVFHCANGGVTCTANPGTPTTETCDGIDNNCDGSVDEGNPTSGPNVDICKVCNGNGKSCLDCNGVPFGSAKVDQCGVCGGDNKTCVSCEEKDIKPILEALDGGAKEIEKIIIKAIAIYKKLGVAKTNANRLYIAKTLDQAHKLQIANWTLSWQLPFISVKCEENPVCVTTSNVPTLNSYRANNDLLKKLAIDALNRIKSANKGKLGAQETKLLNTLNKQHVANLNLSKTVPEVQYSCAK